MSKYIHFSQEEKDRARQTDLAELLRSQGETLKRSGSEFEWRDGSQKVTIRSNLWFHQYDREGGDAIGFVRRFYNKDYVEAMQYLLHDHAGELVISPPVVKRIVPFELPPKNNNMRRAYAYLSQKRKIDREVLNAFVSKGMIYESADMHNAVFVGFDSDGVPRHAHKRSTGSECSYKGNAPGSLPEYSFHWHGTSDRVFLFEAPIDMLSFISMNKKGWQKHSYAASCCTSDLVLWQMFMDNPNIKAASICFDNDKAGHAAVNRVRDKLIQRGVQHDILVPVHKDWNEDRIAREDATHETPREKEETAKWEIQLS